MSSSKTSKSPFLRASSCWTPSKKGGYPAACKGARLFCCGRGLPAAKKRKRGAEKETFPPLFALFPKGLGLLEKGAPLGLCEKGGIWMYGTVLGEGLPRQVLETASLARAVFGTKLCSVLLYGSAALRGIRPDGDRDILMVTERDMTQGESLRMTRRLLELSGRHGDSRQKGCCPNFGQGKSTGQWSGPSWRCFPGRPERGAFQGHQGGGVLPASKKTGEKRKSLSPVFAA